MAAARILIDGFNLALKQGTGIKTYTMLLDQALQLLGADASFLFGHPLAASNDALLSEVLFYDEPVREGNLAARLRYSLGVLGRAALNNSPQIGRVPHNDVVITQKGEGLAHDRALNGMNLYSIAWRRSLTFGKFLDIRAPETFDAVHMTYPIPVRVKGKAKKIVTIHDLIPLRLPYTTTDNKSELLRRHRTIASEADMIFTVSEFSKADIVRILNVDPGIVMVTHQPSRFEPVLDDERDEQARTLRRYGLSHKGYVLFVGAIEPKKNLGRLLRAFVEADVDKPMVVVGPKGWMWQEEIGWLQTNPDLLGKVRFLDHLSVEDLRLVMNGALALTFPSLYEGYGLPVVEAMGFGVPVLTSHTSCLPEVAGDAALYVDPYDIRGIREGIEQLVGDEALRQRLSANGLARSRRITAQSFAEQVAVGYRKLGLLG